MRDACTLFRIAIVPLLLALAMTLFSACTAEHAKLRLKNAASVMEPTLPKDRVITIDLTAYKSSTPKRGDIVAFFPPLDIPDVQQITWCFRVFALPGETVSAEDGKLLVDGKLISVPGQPKNLTYVVGKERDGVDVKLVKLPYTVPENAYFLLGDNPAASNDSRFFGAVPFKNIKGKVELE